MSEVVLCVTWTYLSTLTHGQDTQHILTHIVHISVSKAAGDAQDLHIGRGESQHYSLGIVYATVRVDNHQLLTHSGYLEITFLIYQYHDLQ